MNASPFGSHATTLESSFRSISISFRGNGLECPVLLEAPPGLLEGDAAGDSDVPRAELRRPELPLELLVFAGDDERFAVPGLTDIPGCIFITPAAIPPLTGITTAGGDVPV